MTKKLKPGEGKRGPHLGHGIEFGPRKKLDKLGNIKGCPIKCITGKPRLPRKPIDHSLEDAFADQLQKAEWNRTGDVMSYYEPQLEDCEREYFFALKETPKRMWRFDFAFVDLKIAVEIEGGTNLWRRYRCTTCGGIIMVQTGGRHNDSQGFEEDTEKYNTAACLGWTVLRITGAQVRDGRGLEWLVKLIEAEGNV